MKRNRQKKSLTVSSSRWLAYAAAGAASTLSGTHSAEAEIHYSGMINQQFGNDPGYLHVNVPLANGLRLKFAEVTYSLFFAIDGAAVSNSFCGTYYVRFRSEWVYRLHRGAVISNCNFYPQIGLGGLMLIKAPYSGASFFAKGNGYIGFRFNNGAGMQYGWVRLKMPGPPYFEARFKLVDYAWGDPGDQVVTGQTSSAGDQVEAVPDQGSLGLLALGGAGLMVWRKRRRSSAGSEVSLT